MYSFFPQGTIVQKHLYRVNSSTKYVIHVLDSSAHSKMSQDKKLQIKSLTCALKVQARNSTDHVIYALCDNYMKSNFVSILSYVYLFLQWFYFCWNNWLGSKKVLKITLAKLAPFEVRQSLCVSIRKRQVIFMHVYHVCWGLVYTVFYKQWATN